MSLSLPPAARIKSRGEFLKIQDEGRKLSSKSFLVIVARNDKALSRIGVTVSRRVEKRATRRNYIKRAIRETFRSLRKELEGNFDIVVIARKNAADLKCASIRTELVNLLSRHRLINNVK